MSGSSRVRTKSGSRRSATLGESTLLLGQIEATGRGSENQIVGEVSMLMTFKGGKIVRSQDFFSHAEGLQAAGLAK